MAVRYQLHVIPDVLPRLCLSGLRVYIPGDTGQFPGALPDKILSGNHLVPVYTCFTYAFARWNSIRRSSFTCVVPCASIQMKFEQVIRWSSGDVLHAGGACPVPGIPDVFLCFTWCNSIRWFIRCYPVCVRWLSDIGGYRIFTCALPDAIRSEDSSGAVR